ncbi:ketopantoate reductase family protein [Siccirubricoccus sp. G192]|uniref:ketopantoate reductase family protein n=1 Tax=Siccirubricoccus sp. G192 TaxID=2849651 RepID=UPI001C2CC14D|nr:2-dehydropantoate 2-reductase [Siccirubricoccus sp. G192]MBV1795597.1 2-dehydropantoate 2-reductase [Siccirubricoccus sp. G192]
MRITVLGAGAVGGWLAAGLAEAGHQVGLLARGASLAALRGHGLVLLQGERRRAFRLPASDDPAALAGADLLLLGLKSHDLPGALPLILRLLRPETLVLAVQNGIPWWFFEGFGGPAEGLTLEGVDPGGTLARTLPAGRVIGGVAHVASRVEAPGQVRVLQADRLLLGDPSGTRGEVVAALAAEFRAGGVPAEVVQDIRAEIWLKLWGNPNMNPLSALARADAVALLDDGGARGLVLAMMREMAEIGARIGLPIARDPEERIAVTRRLGAFRTSMLQDLEAGRTMEIGPLLGGLVELAGHLGLPAPTLRGVHGLLRLLARSSGATGSAPG